MRHQQDDLLFGGASETRNINTLSTFFGTILNKTAANHTFDFTDEARTIFVELKTRRINHNQYPTAIIGKNKIDFCSNPDTRYYFVYQYNDGLYYIEYDKDLFATFDVESNYYRSPRRGCINHPQTIVHIPHTSLKRMELPQSCV
jgi:hypothetical protein